jgi:hypothetical protein
MTDLPQDRLQTVDTTNVQILSSVPELSARVEGLAITMTALREMLAPHIRANLETNQLIQMSLESSLRYRAIREEMDESRLLKELEQKTLAVEFLDKKVDSLLEENQETDAIRLELKQAKIDIENLNQQLVILQTARRSTSDKLVSPGKPEKSLRDRAWDVMVLTAVSVTTGAALTGIFAFIWFLVRFYITGAAP